MGTLKHLPALLLGAFLLLFWAVSPGAAAPSDRVSWVYDGDTIQVDGVGTVRLIGIDAPESQNSPRDNYYWTTHRIPSARLRRIARDARDFTIRRLKGERVTLTYDRTRKDKYGRTLAYVFLADGTLFNRLLLERGLAAVFRRFDFRLKDDFLGAEAVARRAGIGLWAE